ncbi:DNA topoisomerase (ATP-hydrolyzing) subunit A [Malacoplasma iowae]|uniref:DNA gyrase subunit A n=1 Tax=Malacoplasma iowae 695 TaxID=1048830 RepID=A0A6P1LN35_MALIO|nr:DNA topoisomerase (ATP-hydrolyzing) subunit A [Malacoplasma iowae]QHG89932.1 DNA topoisomerase (ATP-hydrolyzing) subunit A [Malacoplasma iowae 695]WPL35255.1 DNA topoisomerase (ATP-hydrolyzing) subunit A [Malacoplasma iowae]VEU62171.1 DNA gyrase subunit A [Mycoplasmopsis fermentans]VEU70434.1 DNA gyrase subunit A [Malacoplasma iowae]
MSTNNIDKIKENLSKTKVYEQPISKEIETSFMDYAMSVIVSRALPDVRDGFKPVHRRVLYAAYNLGMTHDKPHKKSARLVGEVIGKFHPHGDSAVYETMVRMAQDFSMRYLLVDGHGNFGSIDGDSAAAMRYTEARLSKISNEMLKNIEKDTIDFIDNYDGSEQEPSVLPALFPNLLANGTSGIAVGMATNIPPHNLSEIIDAVLLLAKNKDVSVSEIRQVLKGPDFPTKAEIVGEQGIISYFETGRGSVTIRSKVDIVRKDTGKSTIIVKEIPYMVNKSNLIEKIVELVRSEAIDGIADLRDESSREGIRIIIETKKDVVPEVLLNKLFKMTPLQTNFSVNMLAIVDGEPKLLNIKEVLQQYLRHQVNVLVRKTKFELKKAKEREHILEGLSIAVNNIDAVIKIIRNAKDNEDAEKQLITKYKLSKIQSKAILDMRLRSLSSLERHKIEDELKEIKKTIIELEGILKSSDKQISIISNELTELKKSFGDERKTEILYGASASIDDEDLIPQEDVVISMSANNYLKRIPIDTYRLQRRGGVGVKGVNTYNDDTVDDIITTTTHTDLLFFTDTGKVYKIRAHEVPVGTRQAKGVPAVNLINIEKNEKILVMLPIDDYSKGFLFLATVNGIVKRTSLSEYNSIRSNGKIAITLREGDKLLSAFVTRGKDEIYLGASNGLLARFNEQDVRIMGRTASGVKGINIQVKAVGRGKNKVDTSIVVVGASCSQKGDLILSIGEKGLGKISEAENYRLTRRGSKGVVTLKQNDRTGKMVFSSAVKGDEDILIVTSSGKIIRTSLSKLRIIGRSTSGVTLVKLQPNEKIVSAALFRPEEEEQEME